MAKSKISFGDCIHCKICFAPTTPKIVRMIPLIKLSKIAVCTVSFNSDFFPAPKKFAATTVVPTESPTKRFTIKFISEPVDPTAPKELSPANLPTTITSAVLKRICNKLEKINGTENCKSFFTIEPSVIFI